MNHMAVITDLLFRLRMLELLKRAFRRSNRHHSPCDNPQYRIPYRTEYT